MRNRIFFIYTYLPSKDILFTYFCVHWLCTVLCTKSVIIMFSICEILSNLCTYFLCVLYVYEVYLFKYANVLYDLFLHCIMYCMTCRLTGLGLVIWRRLKRNRLTPELTDQQAYRNQYKPSSELVNNKYE